MLDESGKNDEEWKVKELKQIKHIDNFHRTHSKISKVMGSKRGYSLVKIQVPIEVNGDIIGWHTVCQEEEVHQSILECNLQYLKQAKLTLFGNGEGYKHLHGENMWKNMRKISEGTDEYKSDVDNVKRWSEELKNHMIWSN